ncbi:uncharacterized protein [Choristoneura fumiferana]|uniref:uncharacterized protein n=1 Tax=Choristoneura fumiferana TaxID=7141 RepID=UPI003D154E6D
MPHNTGESSTFILLMNVINTITHLMLGGVAIGAITFASAFPEQNNLSQHIYLCVTGYIIMMAQAVLTFSPHNGWSLSLSYHDKKDYHWVMQVIGAILAPIPYPSPSYPPHPPCYHWQSIRISLIAMILTCISLVGGVINLYLERTVVTKLLHSGAGTLTLVSAFIGLCLGFDKTIFRLARGQTTSNLLIALTVFALIGTLLTATISNSKRLLRR